MIIYGLEGLERQSQQIMPLAPSFLAASHKPETAFTSLDHADSSTSFLAARWAAPQVYPPWLFLTFLLPDVDGILEGTPKTALKLHTSPTFSPLSLDASPAWCHLFRERFGGNNAILRPRTCPRQVLQELQFCTLHQPDVVKAADAIPEGALLTAPKEPWAREEPLVLWKGAQRPIYKPFYLSTCKRKGTCGGVWLALSHPPPTYNNRVSPHFPQERSTWKRLLIAQLLENGSLCCRVRFWLWAAWKLPPTTQRWVEKPTQMAAQQSGSPASAEDAKRKSNLI